jgi:hypothetical protein
MRIGILLALLLSATFCFADLTLIQKEGDVSRPTYFHNNQSAVRDSTTGLVIDYDKQLITFILLQDSTFCTASITEYHDLAVQFAVDTARQVREAAIEQIMASGSTREDAEKLLKMIQGMAGQDSTLTQPVETVKGESKMIAGFQAVSYLLKRNAVPVRLIWISSDLQKRVDKEIDPTKVKAVNDIMDRIDHEMQAAFTEGQDIPESTLDTAQHALEKQGYLMSIMEMLQDGSLSPSAEIIEISTQPVDPVFFSVPAGFKPIPVSVLFQKQYESNPSGQ